MWLFLETVVTGLPQPITMYVDNLGLAPPKALLADMEGWSIYSWTTVADLGVAAARLAKISIGALLGALETQVVDRNILGSCVTARALLEHALLLDRLTAALEESDVETWLANDGAAIRASRSPPMQLLMAFQRSIHGGRFNWERDRSGLPPKELERAKRSLKDAQTSDNILTILDRRERNQGRTGLRAFYEKLSDCVHPSRGSREILFQGVMQVEGRTVARLYAAQPPSEAAHDERLLELVAPVLVECFVIAERHERVFTEQINAIGKWAWDGLKRANYDVAALLLEEKKWAEPEDCAEEGSSRGTKLH